MDTRPLKLIIVSPEKTLFEGNVDLVTLPGAKGRFTVLQNHDALISLLTKGVIRYVVGTEELFKSIAGGFVEVKNNVVSVCAEL